MKAHALTHASSFASDQSYVALFSLLNSFGMSLSLGTIPCYSQDDWGVRFKDIN